MVHKKYIRGGLVMFDILLMIAAGVSLGLGIFVLRKQYGISEIGKVTENNLLDVALYLLFAGSAFAAVIGFCGCCGACCDNKCLIACHCVLLFCTVLVLISSLCLGFFFRYWVLETLKHIMIENLVTKYGVDTERKINRVVTDFWDNMQIKIAGDGLSEHLIYANSLANRRPSLAKLHLHLVRDGSDRSLNSLTINSQKTMQLGCCGVFGDVNSTTSWAVYKLESHWYKRYTTGRPYIPITCCRRGADANLCTGIRSFRGPPKHGPPIQGDMISNPHMHSIGCYDKLAQYLENKTLVLVCFSLATVLIIVVGMFLSACLCRMLARSNRRYATPRR